MHYDIQTETERRENLVLKLGQLSVEELRNLDKHPVGYNAGFVAYIRVVADRLEAASYANLRAVPSDEVGEILAYT